MRGSPSSMTAIYPEASLIIWSALCCSQYLARLLSIWRSMETQMTILTRAWIPSRAPCYFCSINLELKTRSTSRLRKEGMRRSGAAKLSFSRLMLKSLMLYLSPMMVRSRESEVLLLQPRCLLNWPPELSISWEKYSMITFQMFGSIPITTRKVNAENSLDIQFLSLQKLQLE